jgi:alkanesulfonate monooxygenase SsuD/methylene tetrahydromethanopterin reductase-like flavin-dependent oxidoreductase (luciferase family)
MTALRIGLPGFGTSIDSIVRQAQRAEADGFTSVWYASAVAGDPLAAMAVAGRETTTIELGTAVLQTYACHPLLQAQRAAAVAAAIGAPGRFTLGIGPSHRPVVEDVLGLDYGTPGRHTEDYVDVVAPLLRGDVEVPLLVAALGPRLLRVAGEKTDGTVLWMANARAIADHVAPRIRAAAAAAGRPAPRIVAGLPVAVHDDEDEARATAAEQFAVYGQLPNYQRILTHGGIARPAEAAIVGDEATVADRIQALVDAGATDVWAAPFAVGDDRSASRARTRALLKDLVTG